MAYINYSPVAMPVSRQPVPQYPDFGQAVYPPSARSQYPALEERSPYSASTPYSAQLGIQQLQQLSRQPQSLRVSFPPPPTQQYYYPTPLTEPVSPDDGTRRYRCNHTSCGQAFGRKADLERHDRIVHNRETLALIDCPQPRCHRKGSNGFTRTDKVTDHLREYHKLDIPKKIGGGGRRGS